MGLNVTSTQGDIKYREFFDMLKKAKATIDISNNIDLGPVLMVFSSLNHGSTLTGTKRLRIKESRRDMALKEELKKIGVNVTIKENSVTISKYNGNYDYMEFDSHNDHRVLMSLSLLSLFMDVRIDKAECINKSYPNYFKDLVKLGFEVSYEE